MAVKIRLSRLGRKNRPFWRIIAIDSRKKRDGAFLDNLGTYDPINKTLVAFHLDRIQDWISKGAQPSATVAKLLKMHKREAAA